MGSIRKQSFCFGVSLLRSDQRGLLTIVRDFSDTIEALWAYLETLMAQLNVTVTDPATVAIAYDTRSAESHSPAHSHPPLLDLDPVVRLSPTLCNVQPKRSLQKL